jgi:hypothetical protein
LNKRETWTPHKLRLDEAPAHIVPHSRWDEMYTEMMQNPLEAPTTRARVDFWFIEADDEIVHVPAGTFKAMRIRKRTTDADDGKTYWFADAWARSSSDRAAGARNCCVTTSSSAEARLRGPAGRVSRRGLRRRRVRRRDPRRGGPAAGRRGVRPRLRRTRALRRPRPGS